jgi:glycyl-tRNA synthetase
MVPGEYAVLCEDLLSSLQIGDHKNLAGGCARFLVTVKEFPAEKWLAEMHVIDPETGEPGDWTAPRQFNLMFDTHIGPIKDDDHKAYLRPETAQGMFVNFKNVLDTMRRRLPFGIAQVGRSFRNEITPGNFIFRQREFEQMEIEYFCMPEDAEAKYWDWIAYRRSWWEGLGVAPERLRTRPHATDELAHYAAACSDIEYLFPGSLGWNELEGIANRTNYDLTAHSKDNEVVAEARKKFGMESPNTDSVETLTYFDEKSKTHLIPFVIEPAAGVDRAFLTFLCDAYCEELVGEIANADRKAVREALEAFVKSVAKKLEGGRPRPPQAGDRHGTPASPSAMESPRAPEPVEGRAKPAESAPSTDKLAAMLDLGNAILAGGDQDLARISTLLSLPGAEQIELGKKLRGVAERVVDGAFRTVLKLHPKLSPIKVAIFPLKKNHDGIVAKAKDILRDLKPHMKAVYDDTGAIGKLYRRQDEIGTPFCITVDFQSLEDNTVTIRHRDSMSQERVGTGVLREWLEKRIG